MCRLTVSTTHDSSSTIPLAHHWPLRLVCAVMLAGHAWMCWNGQMPLRALLWDEELFSGVVKRFAGMDWGEWVSSLDVDDGINRAIRIQAWVFFAFAAAALVPLRLKFLSLLYLLTSLNLVFLAWLKYHDSGVGVAQFFEHSSQFLMPLVLFGAIWYQRWMAMATIGIALTFIAHGVFAIGMPAEITWLNHARPGNFIEVTMLCLGLETEAPVGRALLVAGILDFVVVVLLFFRGWPRVAGLGYMFVWGFATALARPWAHYEPTAATDSLLRWIPELLYRAPHFAIPLCLLLALRRRWAES